jgi:hypothetical protein
MIRNYKELKDLWYFLVLYVRLNSNTKIKLLYNPIFNSKVIQVNVNTNSILIQSYFNLTLYL